MFSRIVQLTSLVVIFRFARRLRYQNGERQSIRWPESDDFLVHIRHPTAVELHGGVPPPSTLVLDNSGPELWLGVLVLPK
jgi:hypothetical protein